ncbi:MAG: glycosyltransferase family 2 protein, partial [Lachnospiraceae bacterium]|nr:glycosyltransferase family 2 protein [Lachnospiraceae bacterium]
MMERRTGLVSIVVPVYNAERFIAETISYVQKQTYAEWELLLVDDCSTDQSREII